MSLLCLHNNRSIVPLLTYLGTSHATTNLTYTILLCSASAASTHTLTTRMQQNCATTATHHRCAPKSHPKATALQRSTCMCNAECNSGCTQNSTRMCNAECYQGCITHLHGDAASTSSRMQALACSSSQSRSELLTYFQIPAHLRCHMPHASATSRGCCCAATGEPQANAALQYTALLLYT